MTIRKPIQQRIYVYPGERLDLSTLQITDKELLEIVEAPGLLTNRTEPYLADNQLTVLPDAIGSLTDLTWLYLSGNQLTGLPDAIGSLTKLTKLDLRGNQLTDLPDAIGSLTKLTRLHLSSNCLTKVPKTLERFFDLADQNLTEATNLTKLLKKIKKVLDPSQEVSETDLEALADHLKTITEEEDRLDFLVNFDDSIVAALIHEARLKPKKQNYLAGLAKADPTPRLGSTVQSAIPNNRR